MSVAFLNGVRLRFFVIVTHIDGLSSEDTRWEIVALLDAILSNVFESWKAHLLVDLTL